FYLEKMYAQHIHAVCCSDSLRHFFSTAFIGILKDNNLLDYFPLLKSGYGFACTISALMITYMDKMRHVDNRSTLTNNLNDLIGEPFSPTRSFDKYIKYICKYHYSVTITTDNPKIVNQLQHEYNLAYDINRPLISPVIKLNDEISKHEYQLLEILVWANTYSLCQTLIADNLL